MGTSKQIISNRADKETFEDAHEYGKPCSYLKPLQNRTKIYEINKLIYPPNPPPSTKITTSIALKTSGVITKNITPQYQLTLLQIPQKLQLQILGLPQPTQKLRTSFPIQVDSIIKSQKIQHLISAYMIFYSCSTTYIYQCLCQDE
jgi:hypothetical protein